MRQNKPRYQRQVKNGLSIHGNIDARPAADALEALPDSCCRWPIGEVNDMGFRFCGKKRHFKSSYCGVHEILSREVANA
ncbi:MAG: GcrA family cell cycle regulator [Rhodomicrobium sp.]